MAITVNRATLARQVNGEIQYIYPKTYADMVEYDENSKENIKDIIDNINSNSDKKVNSPIDNNGNVDNGTSGQILSTNADGTTSWVDLKEINPDLLIKVDPTLKEEGKAADAKAVGDAISNLEESIESLDDASKVNKPIGEDGNAYDGEAGQILETNGDGSTSWVKYARVYVGSGDMPEGYDVQIDPNATTIEIDRTLTIDGAIAESSSVGNAIKNLDDKINELEANTEENTTSITNITELINGVRDYILFKDVINNYIYIVRVENGVLVCISKCVSISVTTMPNKTEYDVGEVFDPTGMVVTATCEDGSTRPVRYTYDTSIIKENTESIQITYIENGVTFNTSVPITFDSNPISLIITNGPTKNHYFIGEVFDPTGMVVTVKYEDGTEKEVTDYTYSKDVLTADSNITISYKEDEKVLTAIVPIIVSAKLIKITINTQPTKTNYIAGDYFDPAGMIVAASYDDGSIKQITDYRIPTNVLAVGTPYVTIFYTEMGIEVSADINITVTEHPSESLKDFNYIINDDGTYTITGWKGTFNGVTSTECVVPDNELIIVNPTVNT